MDTLAKDKIYHQQDVGLVPRWEKGTSTVGRISMRLDIPSVVGAVSQLADLLNVSVVCERLESCSSSICLLALR